MNKIMITLHNFVTSNTYCNHKEETILQKLLSISVLKEYLHGPQNKSLQDAKF